MELTTEILSGDNYKIGIARVIEFLRTVGTSKVIVSYGFDCDCPENELYQPLTIPLDTLQLFIIESEAKGYYRPRQNDLWVDEPNGIAKFLFCHESDIHLTSDSVELICQMQELWQDSGLVKCD